MRFWYIFVFFFIFPCSVYSSEITDIINDADLHFQDRQIHEGKVLLESLSNRDDLTDEEKALVNNKIAWFYEELVGNYQYARRYTLKVLQYSLPAAHPSIIEAKDRIERLKQVATIYSKENAIVKNMRIGATDRDDAGNKIKALKQLIKDSPEYPDRMVAYHYIGKHYLYLNKYYRSYRVLSKVLKHRPGIVFLLPTESLMERAKSKWNHFILNVLTRIIIIGTLMIISIFLFLSRFWEWMSLSFLLSLPVTIIIWAIFLMSSAWGLNFLIPDQEHIYLETPCFIQGSPFSPGSEILLTIFFYGVLGILCSFLLTLATRRIEPYKKRIMINSSVLLLFFGSIFTIFYFNHCYNTSIFEERADSLFPSVTGHTYLLEQDYEPLILINPRAYPDLTLNNTVDKVFINWIKKQYLIISSQSAENIEKGSRKDE